MDQLTPIQMAIGAAALVVALVILVVVIKIAVRLAIIVIAIALIAGAVVFWRPICAKIAPSATFWHETK